MGTRGLTIVTDRENVIRVAQYGQWDHYPSGQGLTALEFISSPENLASLESSLSKCFFMEEEEISAIQDQYAPDKAGWMTMEQMDAYSRDWPTLTRDTGAKILEIIINSPDRVPLWDDSLFSNDDLFCEGIYHINFAAWKFYAYYNGTNKEYDLDKLPTVEEFLNDFSIDEEE